MVDVPYSSPDDIVCFRHTAGYGIIGLINKIIYPSTEKYYTLNLPNTSAPNSNVSMISMERSLTVANFKVK